MKKKRGVSNISNKDFRHCERSEAILWEIPYKMTYRIASSGYALLAMTNDVLDFRYSLGKQSPLIVNAYDIITSEER